MANVFSNMINSVGDWLGQKIAPYINDAMGIGYNILGQYYAGDHRKQLKTKPGAQDENITQNFIGLAVDRSVSRLYKGGVEWKLPEGAKKQQEYLDKLWDLNKKEILLYQAGLHGAVYGTSYMKICPDEKIDPYTGGVYPKLIALDPTIVRIKTAHDDMGEVAQYRIEYTYKREQDGREVEVCSREIVRKTKEGDYETESESQTWTIEEWEQVGGAPWELVLKLEWQYDFPPIVHWKNLPSLKSCYGDSDIDDAINVQDKSNFVVSNTGKIIKFHAHPQTVGTGFSVKQMEPLDGAVNTFHAIPNPEAKVYNLEMSSDLASSRAFALDLRQSIFDTSREVDISSMSDQLGALTNFGLQVLWSDALDKNDTKRQLYGDAFLELNRRLLVLANYTAEQSNPGDVQWGAALPVNIEEELRADKLALELGIIDKESVAIRYVSRYGKSWEDIKKAVEAEKKVENENNANIGATILRNFSQGKGINGNQPINQKPTQGA